MTDFQLTTPVAFLIFNRPDTTARVFEAIRQAKPPKLLVVADGPRPDRADDIEKCNAARAIIDGIDWDCEVLTNYSDVNLGCKSRVSSGLDWVFEIVEEAIILEDDCLPHSTFFRFCQELLKLYRNDSRIMQICGSNFLNGKRKIGESYYFSKYGPTWGWASWQRAWKYYDVDMSLWKEVKNKQIYYDFCENKEEILIRINLYDKIVAGEIDTWDYQWSFAKFINSGLSITPNVNLISNIGFREDATHTFNPNTKEANMSTSAIEFPLKHPLGIYRDRKADEIYFAHTLKRSSLKSNVRKFVSLLKSLSAKVV
ncbi:MULTISPECIES: glycosyltransferase family 2 protein [Microcystis]|uniref:glycosyltransferase family 2 protein n=1 Tax=Microcystis TaxID=1125 RepID=UPI00258BD38E|nr:MULTISPECIES: glycosyltransferase family 2 protein [Microcystis]MCA2716825.1 glycosyltransferase family 2 protein [Microcystis sp. M169S2]WNF15587.1 glycosyltransferase family 2 protein [Microcystis aeruginosa NRERC-214]